MPLDLPVKVRSWELTVYPRSHIRRWFGVTRPAKPKHLRLYRLSRHPLYSSIATSVGRTAGSGDPRRTKSAERRGQETLAEPSQPNGGVRRPSPNEVERRGQETLAERRAILASLAARNVAFRSIRPLPGCGRPGKTLNSPGVWIELWHYRSRAVCDSGVTSGGLSRNEGRSGSPGGATLWFTGAGVD